MSEQIQNPPAFPMPDFTHPDGRVEHGYHGMTLRDFFAAKAMASLYAHYGCPKQSDKDIRDDAKISFRIADAMLAERTKGQPK